ncbi:MAG TPA: diaminobutyrate--2-oxoglutarate transaminase [Halieaceae bacterium]|uniref:diaminobutyrate--2-oxoglutarate transaminase n=1 Tax=Haliea TaxID=475794 RepID=UPI0004125F4B|nr:MULTISPECIES: diaminobutyrate--2-oxoglutarate transaminase [Haliea]HBM82279.1 diaminobutyrate--2-oxoglutarate transaminase [Halieaceae bacterium]MAD62098.1 diaminobutyrate--2-oxoglutarate transaminase [Haliea sp.]MAY93899.1 diaminobutyrate--2-oxoglutarate transaminase [Haliea sp.]MBK41658.1 diaminobutyrate--2-oxoglutarate transaminase [Haliea sp.]MBP70920.1 diaminobutyrate--2-oxoglutarate transaminase [Haliea sp.]
MEVFDEYESEVRGYIRSFPTVFDKAVGSELFDEDGRRYIDFFAGAGTLNYGHNPERAVEAQIQYLRDRRIAHGLDKATVAKKAFLETFIEKILEPRQMEYKLQFTGPTGTNCTEAAMKLARQATGRNLIVAFTNGYHGHTMGALAVTGNQAYRDESYGARGAVNFMPFDGFLGDMDTLYIFERYLDDKGSGLEAPAAVIVETVQGEGGINVASSAWLQGLEKLCRKHGILLIVDDIQVGNGRTGKFFSFEEAGIRPDLICLSKSIGGGNPMAVLLINPEVDVWSPGEHTGTFRGNSLAFVAAKELIDQYWSDDSLTNEVYRKSEIVLDTLRALRDEFPQLNSRVKGRGLVVGIETPIDGFAAEVAAAAFERMLVCETCGADGHVNKLFVALTIEDDILREGLDIFADVFREVARKHA